MAHVFTLSPAAHDFAVAVLSEVRMQLSGRASFLPKNPSGEKDLAFEEA